MLFWLSIAITFMTILIAIELTRGNRQLKALDVIAPLVDKQALSLSIIVAARNEERNIREALQSLLALDYPRLQRIVVNDRSDDQTADILEEMAGSNPGLEVLHIHELPAGWLGKNHALWQGAQIATGELLLFTDADVVMAPDTLRRAVSYLHQENLDHLAATPKAKMPNLFLNLFGITFGIFFGLFTRPWKASNPRSRAHIGIGAFNLVRAEAYRQTGGHQTIALRPDDDLKLGKIIKQAGFRQQLVFATNFISVEWYSSVREVILGLEKNIYAGTDYRLWYAACGVIFNLLVFIWPYLALLVTTGSTRIIYTIIVAIISLTVADSARRHGYSPWYAIGFPLATALFLFIIVRSLTVNLVTGGINWRGTFYSLDELRKNRI